MPAPKDPFGDLPANTCNAFCNEEECPPPESPFWAHVKFDAGLFVTQPVRVTNNPAYLITTNPPVQRFTTNPALRIADQRYILPTGNPVPAAQTTEYDFQFGRAVIPMLGLSVANDSGFGVRLGWWGFNQNANSLQPSFGGLRTPLRAVNGDISAGIVPAGGMGNTTIRSPGPFRGFGIVSPDTSRLLDPLILPGTPLPIGRAGPGDDEPNIGPARGLSQSLLANQTGADLFSFSDRLRMNVWDIEATQSAALGPVGLSGTAGVRYAYVSQTYAAGRFNAASFTIPTVEVGFADDFVNMHVNPDSAVLAAGESFSGIGPTLSLGAQYQPPALGGLGVFANVRGSVLFGQQKQTAFQLTQFVGTATAGLNRDRDFNKVEYNTTQFNVATYAQNEFRRKHTVTPWEGSAGLEWGRASGWANFYVQAAVTIQEWIDVGSATSLKGDLRLFGLSVTTGFDF
jgi:hypothetical protein